MHSCSFVIDFVVNLKDCQPIIMQKIKKLGDSLFLCSFVVFQQLRCLQKAHRFFRGLIVLRCLKSLFFKGFIIVFHCLFKNLIVFRQLRCLSEALLCFVIFRQIHCLLRSIIALYCPFKSSIFSTTLLYFQQIHSFYGASSFLIKGLGDREWQYDIVGYFEGMRGRGQEGYQGGKRSFLGLGMENSGVGFELDIAAEGHM